MADSRFTKRDRSAPDVDISKPGTTSTLGHAIGIGCLTCLLLFLLINAAVTDQIGFAFETCAFLLGAGLIAVGWTLIVRRGVLTWMPLAHKPLTLLEEGAAAAADCAFETALSRAKQFDAHDHRRGLMLIVLAGYLEKRGRAKEAGSLFAESIAILERHAHKHPMDYFVALNNFAVSLIHLKDFAAAQPILERVLDMTLAAKRGPKNVFPRAAPAQLRAIDFVLHYNLTLVFIAFDELAEARARLHEAEELFPTLNKANQGALHDPLYGLRARWNLDAGNIDESRSDCERLQDPSGRIALRMRAKLHLRQQEHAEAEVLLQEFRDRLRNTGMLRHPDHVEPLMDLAECQYHLGDRDVAFTTLDEARGLAAEFALPSNAKWKSRLHPWLERAKEIGNTTAVRNLDAELRVPPTSTEQSIMILDKFRIHRRGPQPSN